MIFEVFCLAAFLIPIGMFLFSVLRFEPAPSDRLSLQLRDLEPGDDHYVSDEEFLAGCAQGVRPDIAFTVRRIIAEVACIPEHEIHPSDRLVDDLGLE